MKSWEWIRPIEATIFGAAGFVGLLLNPSQKLVLSSSQGSKSNRSKGRSLSTEKSSSLAGRHSVDSSSNIFLTGFKTRRGGVMKSKEDEEKDYFKNIEDLCEFIPCKPYSVALSKKKEGLRDKPFYVWESGTDMCLRSGRSIKQSSSIISELFGLSLFVGFASSRSPKDKASSHYEIH